MKRINRTAGLAAAASLALALTTVACGESGGSIVSPTQPAPVAPAPVATFTVSGTVSENSEAGAVPLEGASIINFETESSALTDSEGSYRLGGLRAGMARFVVSKEGYQDWVVEMMIEGDAHLDAVLVRSESN